MITDGIRLGTAVAIIYYNNRTYVHERIKAAHRSLRYACPFPPSHSSIALQKTIQKQDHLIVLQNIIDMKLYSF